MTQDRPPLPKKPKQKKGNDASGARRELRELKEGAKKIVREEAEQERRQIDEAMKEIDRLNAEIEAEKDRQLLEVSACLQSFRYFVDKYCYLYDSGDSKSGRDPGYVPFHLWPGQYPAVEAIENDRLVLILKARQLGMTWLCLAYALWTMTFRNDATVLLFSLRDNEACEMAGRLFEMWKRLPEWMRIPLAGNNAHSMTFVNGSKALAFPTTGGDSYNATVAIVDEADLVPDLNRMMSRIKPTIDAGGKLFLVSRVDKKTPKSYFKETYRAIQRGELPKWSSVFLPWSVRPERNAEWYEDQKNHSLSTTGSLDDLYEQYPSTPEECLAPDSRDKRFPSEWLAKCFKDMKPLNPIMFKPDAPLIPQMKVFVTPDPRRSYSMGADPAQGNPNSDDSALVVLDDVTGEEVCNLVGKFEPAVFGSMISKIAKWYKAGVLVERNNHGHAVLLWLADNGRCRVLDGPDEDKGFYTTSTTKIQAYDKLAEDIRSNRILIHDRDGHAQLSSVEAATLKAPDGEHDDRAMSWLLANYARGGAINYSKVEKHIRKPEHSFVRANQDKIFG